MSLIKNTGTIAGFTIISRIFGFVRDMLLARVLGAGLAADAYQLAFTLPNTFRRLFAEGAFSVAFIPMYSRRLEDEDGEARAQEFADDVLSIFIWILLGFSALAMLAMPLIVYGLASEFQNEPGKFELAVFLSRMTFPYLFFISLVAMLSGLLNARSRFAPGAIAPVLFNFTLISGIIIGYYARGSSDNDVIVVQILSAAVALSGLVQLIYLWWAVKRAGVKLQVKRPRLTPEVKRLGIVILPATFGAGIYQISQFVDTFFATSLPQGSLTLLKMADRLNQMPLGIVGIALGTAILPMLSRHIQSGNQALAQRLQTDAFEMATLLTLPAAAALAVCAPAFTNAFFVGGKFTLADGAIMSNIVVALVAGLPAYVIIKILVPGFFARSDTRTPVYTALASLIVNIGLNIYVVMYAGYGIVGLAAATAASATLNCILLYTMLHRRGYFHFTAALGSRIFRQAIATAIMASVLWLLMQWLGPNFSADAWSRVWSLITLVVIGGGVYAVAGFTVGAVDKARITALIKRKPIAAQENEA
ncbi:murein biosynthesis integral membrane protein MurJ [Parasphingorhabdus halotolerans]|uniref:Probable lipid II flippase MurJ n=1 Tax=Parasphingorhabdus halotolerans TaxID=2725558 RepID=A0A6H2DN59_9SPHN|nr:murein biosynthesis integral membrane protein MurJ [Parasphingorhabdus halotolerans]QJB69820.1 murein biosynthesis integral membrane protein MurJ [Parasphingorhabdus halotolerans]